MLIQEVFVDKKIISAWFALGKMLTGYWGSLTLTDFLTAAYIIILVLFVIGCNYLFTKFVESKPEGRKTVLGELFFPLLQI